MSVYRTRIDVPRPDHLTGGSWVIDKLNQVTVLFGRNGIGKSILLRALRTQNPQGYHYASPERAGEISHDMSIVQEELGASRGNRRANNFANTFRQEAVSRIQSMQLKMGYVAGMQRPVTVDLKTIQNLVDGLLQEFEFEIRPEAKPYKLVRKASGEEIPDVARLSSGEAELFSLAVDVLTICAIWELDDVAERILLIDEPDTHLHPDLQQHLAQFLLRVVDKYNTQMIVSTHSTTLLSALGYHGRDKTSVVYLDNSAIQQHARQFTEHLQEMATLLGGHALMGPLFGTPILLVEGDDEYRIWSHVPRLHQVQLVALPCGGASEVKSYARTLEAIFKSLLTQGTGPVGYGLLDGDKSIPTSTDGFIGFLKLSCRESENLYLSEEVLNVIGVTWDQAKVKITQQASNFGQKQSALEACVSWDRKTADIKNVIEQVAEIVDPKRVHWTLRVAKAIGKGKPRGQLAEFLGQPLIDAFWPAADVPAASE